MYYYPLFVNLSLQLRASSIGVSFSPFPPSSPFLLFSPARDSSLHLPATLSLFIHVSFHLVYSLHPFNYFCLSPLCCLFSCSRLLFVFLFIFLLVSHLVCKRKLIEQATRELTVIAVRLLYWDDADVGLNLDGVVFY